MSQYDTYQSPLAVRNASPEMLRIWSPRHKFNTWRRIWLAVAEAQHEVTKGDAKPLVTPEQVAELRAVVECGITDEEIDRASEIERELRHDVMAHVHCLGEQCPKAKPILHLGMTSQDVVCNADLLIIEEAAAAIRPKLLRVCSSFATAGARYSHIPTLGFTHFQPAQPTTVGRRCAGWSYELNLCWENLYRAWNPSCNTLLLRGMRGATGTQASFLALFDGDGAQVDYFEAELVGRLHPDAYWKTPLSEDAEHDYQEALTLAHQMVDQSREDKDAEDLSHWEKRVAELESMTLHQFITDSARFYASNLTFGYTGQTYPRVYDCFKLSQLAAVAAVLHKIATDIRLLVNRKELDEPFGDKQVGSSAMPYKRNPMRCERICGLTRFVMNLVGNAYHTAATQWLERTLDDSSNRRLSLPEAFLALDGSLDLMHNVASGLVVHEAMVKRNLMAELPFLATENILMEAVKLGGDRQDLHEKIRVHAQAAGSRVKDEGLDNDLLERLQADPAFVAPALKHDLDWSNLMDPMRYIGRSVEQTERFIKEVVEPLRERYADELKDLADSEPRV